MRVRVSRRKSGDMPFSEHLRELTRRVMISAAAVAVGAIGGWMLFDVLWSGVSGPVTAILNSHSSATIAINFTTVTSAFDIRMKISIIAGIVLASPIWIYQLFAFFIPGLTKTERQYTIGFSVATLVLFASGVVTGWIILPHIVEMMTSFVPAGAATFYEAKTYLEFVTKLMLATGVAFVLPCVLVLLNFVGVLSGKGILRAWRWAAVAITLFCAIATPAADVLSMFLLAIPMTVLYFGAVGVSLLHDRRAIRRLATLQAT